MEPYIDILATVAMNCVALVTSFFAIRALARSQRGFGGWMRRSGALGMVFLGVVAVWETLPGYYHRLELYREYVTAGGQSTEGEVVSVAMRKKRGLKSNRYAYYLDVRYKDTHGKEYYTLYVSSARMNRGDKVPVFYKPESPHDAYVVTYHESCLNNVLGVVFGGSCVLLAFVGVVILWLNRKAGKRRA